MQNTFDRAEAFNKPLNWDTSTGDDDCRAPFAAAEAFNPALRWDTSAVTAMERTFSFAIRFNRRLAVGARPR